MSSSSRGTSWSREMRRKSTLPLLPSALGTSHEVRPGMALKFTAMLAAISRPASPHVGCQPMRFLPIPKIFGYISPFTRGIDKPPIITFLSAVIGQFWLCERLCPTSFARCGGPEICLFSHHPHFIVPDPNRARAYLLYQEHGIPRLCPSPAPLLITSMTSPDLHR
jgi:hypothetical protein